MKSICVGEDLSWADNVSKMLKKIDSEYILLLLEDYFIDRNVDNSTIEQVLKFIKDHNIDCLRLEPLPPPVKVQYKNLKLGKLIPGAPYYVSTQPAIWKKDILLELLHEGYSAWDFEQKNSTDIKIKKYNFWGTKAYIFHHKNGVERGKYYRSTIDFLKAEKINFDIADRTIIEDKNIFQKYNLLKYNFKMWIKRICVEYMRTKE